LQDIPDGDSSVYWLLSQAKPKVKRRRTCVLAAVKKNGLALDVASNNNKTDKEIVLAAVAQDGDAFSYVDKLDQMWKEKDFVLQMVKMQGSALQYAHTSLTADEEVVTAAILNKGSALQYAANQFKANKDVALAAVTNEGGAAFLHVAKTGVMWKDKDFVLSMVRMQGNALQYVDKHAEIWSDQEFVLRMVEMQGNALKFAADHLRADKKVVVAAIKESSDALEFVDKNATLWEDEAVVLSLVQSTGRALQFASEQLKENKEVVLAAVRTTPTAVRFASAKMTRDCDVMKDDRKEDREQQGYAHREQAILSLGFTNSDYAANFVALLKRNEYLRNFKTYNPNAWRRSCCGPDFQNISNACRGTNCTCKFADSQNLFEDAPGGEQKPANQSCWRFSFRFHLEHEVKATQGFMIQVQDKNGLHDGQKIEADIAQQADVKIFRTMTTSEDVTADQLVVLEEAIKDWYKKGCKNHYMAEIQLR